MRRTGILAGLLLLFYGGLTWWKPEVMVSPGHLLQGHAEIEPDCLSCHSLFRGVTKARCVYCHRVDEIGLSNASGEPLREPRGIPFHSDLREGACTACHTDHRGEGAHETIPQALSRATKSLAYVPRPA